ncbi:hypothetical protein CXK96_07130 [Stutzerimonas stutzeri]|nr:hypothetical protein CXK96_07130 [Stutzerimonas stutzeri]
MKRDSARRFLKSLLSQQRSVGSIGSSMCWISYDFTIFLNQLLNTTSFIQLGGNEQVSWNGSTHSTDVFLFLCEHIHLSCRRVMTQSA